MSYKIDTIVFSKDRAAQLDLFLSSFLRNFPIGNVFIIYDYSSEQFQRGYGKLYENMYPYNGIRFYWIKQQHSIKEEFLTTLDGSSGTILNLCTDDCVYFRKPEITEAKIESILDNSTLCFSPRLGLNTIIQDYKTGELQKPLCQDEDIVNYDNDNILHWHWVSRPPLQNYGFACHQDSYICRKEDFLKIANFNWQNMRQLEGTLALERRHTMYYKPRMAALAHSFCVNIPTNNVLAGLYHSDKCYQSLEVMNERYLNNERLSLDKTDFSQILGSHQEVNLQWEKY